MMKQILMLNRKKRPRSSLIKTVLAIDKTVGR